MRELEGSRARLTSDYIVHKAQCGEIVFEGAYIHIFIYWDIKKTLIIIIKLLLNEEFSGEKDRLLTKVDMKLFEPILPRKALSPQ